MIPENLSSEVVGKNFFHEYMEEYQRCWIERIREKGKYSFIHMDGTLKGLVQEEGSVGFTVMEALTPKPVSDLSLRPIREKISDDTIVWGEYRGLFYSPG